MKWNESFSATEMPSLETIAAFVDNPLWGELCSHLESHYGVLPSVEYSTCSGAPGWNVKYKKSGRALCTLYPDKGFFTCLVVIGNKEAYEAEQMITLCTAEVAELYRNTKQFNGTRWLMIKVESPSILTDVKELIALRMRKKNG